MKKWMNSLIKIQKLNAVNEEVGIRAFVWDIVKSV